MKIWNLLHYSPRLALLPLALTCFCGHLEAEACFPVATNPAVVQVGFGMACDGTNYLAGLMSGGNVCGQLVAPTGASIGPLVTVGTSPGLVLPAAAVTFGRTNYLIVWSDASVSSGVDMFGQFISQGGAKVGSAFPLLASQGTHWFQVLSTVAFDGNNFLVVWQDTGNNYLYGQLVTQGGVLAGGEFVISSQVNLDASGPTVYAAAAFGKTNYLVAWVVDDPADQGASIYGAPVATTGSAGSPFQINQLTANGSTPALAFDGTNFLAAWTWGTNPQANWSLRGRLVSPAATFAGGEVALVTNETAMLNSVGFDGANYLMAWTCRPFQTNSDVRFCFLDRSAAMLGPEFSLFAAQGTNVPLFALGHLAFNGTSCVIAATLGVLGVDKNPQQSGEVFGASIASSAARPRVAPAGPHAGAQFPLLLTGTPGINYAIQMATNLAAPNWMPLATNSPTNGTFRYTDLGATNKSRYYRAVKQ